MAERAVAKIVLDLQAGEDPWELLGAVPVESFDDDRFYGALVYLLNVAAEGPNVEGIKSIIYRWELANGEAPGDDMDPVAEGAGGTLVVGEDGEADAIDFGLSDNYSLPIRARLFTFPQLDDAVLSVVAREYADRTLEDYMLILIKYDSVPELAVAAARMLAFFPGGTDVRLWRDLEAQLDALDDTTEVGNSVMRIFVSEQIRENAEYAPKPDWVRDFGVDLPPSERAGVGRLNRAAAGTLPTDQELAPPPARPLTFEMPSEELAVEILTANLQLTAELAHGQDADDSLYAAIVEAERERVREAYSRATPEARRELLLPLYRINDFECQARDVTLHRILGPAHPTVGQTPDEGEVCPCAHYGGCRMFTCAEFENYDPYQGVIDEDFDGRVSEAVDWWQGSCDSCLRRIRHRHWAVRRPQPHGGWIGCYCSWECVADSINRPEDAFVYQVIKVFKSLMDENGIQDRRYLEGYE